jgi:uncharacterized membrane protein YdjX (TVP38/TMEM64 family)
MNDIVQFFNRMDARATRAIWISLALFGMVAALFVVGRFGLNIEPSSLQTWFQNASNEWYALPVTILVFSCLAFLGVPQFALIGAAVFAFGPVLGFFFSWIATMISASVTFWTGRILGADTVRRYGGETVNRISSFVGRNGFFASMIVRIVPSAPFIVVNMAAGVSRMSYIAFVAGVGVGVIPKTAVIAFFGGTLMAVFAGGGLMAWLALGGAALLWIVIMLVARHLLRRPETQGLHAQGEPDAVDPGDIK